MGKEIEIKKLPEFEAMVNAGNTTYTGLVEGIGYVYWTTETIMGDSKISANTFPLFSKERCNHRNQNITYASCLAQKRIDEI